MGWFHNIWDDVLTWTYRNHIVPKVGLSCYNNDWLHDCRRRLSSGFNINKYLPDGLDIWVPFWCWSKHVLLPIRGNLRPVLFKASLLSQWDHFLREWCRHTLHGSFPRCVLPQKKVSTHLEQLCSSASCQLDLLLDVSFLARWLTTQEWTDCTFTRSPSSWLELATLCVLYWPPTLG